MGLSVQSKNDRPRTALPRGRPERKRNVILTDNSRVLFPLNGPRRLTRDIVNDARDALVFINDPI